MCAVVSAIEHKAVLAAAHAVCRLGGREVIIPVNGQGSWIRMRSMQPLAQHPSVVSVMWVNNEIGVIQPMAEIAARCCAAGVTLHTDAVQAFGKVPCGSVSAGTLHDAHVSGHKIGAPKGVGALVVRDNKAVEAIIHGGGQQYGIRPGTENVAGAVALGRAAKLATAEQEAEARAAPRTAEPSWPSASRRAFPTSGLGRNQRVRSARAECRGAGADSEALLMHLDMAGIAASGGSACSTGAVEPSHVLLAIGMPRELALGAVRFSLGHESTEADVDRGRGGHARCRRQGAEAGGDPRSCVIACWSPCRVAWIVPSRRRVSLSRATRWSEPP